jgi:hypothetical protein
MPLAAPHILVTDVADTRYEKPLPAPFSFLDAVASLSDHLCTVTTLRLR